MVRAESVRGDLASRPRRGRARLRSGALIHLRGCDAPLGNTFPPVLNFQLEQVIQFKLLVQFCSLHIVPSDIPYGYLEHHICFTLKALLRFTNSLSSLNTNYVSMSFYDKTILMLVKYKQYNSIQVFYLNPNSSPSRISLIKLKYDPYLKSNVIFMHI